MDLRLWLKSGLNKWRMALLVFMIVYAVFLLLEIGYMSIQWDEAPHLYGGLILSRGQPQEYVATYGYYPPLYDLLTTIYFLVFGVSAASGRLVAVTFSLLTVLVVFEFANRTYGPKTGLIASIILGTMPGFFWLSRVAMLETMLMFFFALALFFFLSWMRFNQNKALILCGVVMGVGLLAKYQILVAGLVMIAAILLLYRDKLRLKLSKFMLLAIIAVIVIVPWVLIIAQINGLNKLGDLLYVIQEGGQDRALYSSRFPMPIFYLIEMTWPFNDIPVHPISLLIYILGLFGLGLWAYRRKPEDKFFLLWFMVIYVFFTLIPNKQWRYVTPIFPVLAISAASFIVFLYSKMSATWKRPQISLNKQKALKVAAALFVFFAATAIVYSSYDAYQMTVRDQIHIPIGETTDYVASHMGPNESAVVVCAFNLFNQDMFRFYLPANMSPSQIWQYPTLPVDAFTPNFNITEFVDLCEQRNVRYLILYDFGGNTPFFNTTLTYTDVTQMILDTGKFGYTGDEPFFGDTLNYRTFLVGFRQAYNLDVLTNSSLGL